MESAHSHHQLQDQLVASSASSLAPPSCYGVGFTTHAWTTPISFLNTNNGFNPSYSSETLLTSRETRHQENTILPNSHYTSMAADLGFNWANNTAQNFTTTTDQCEQDLHHTRIKEELTDLYYRKYTSDIDNEQRNLQQNDLTTKLLLKSSNLTNKIQLPPLDLYSDNVGGGENNGRGFCQIFPSVNVSSLNQMGLTNARALDMNLEAVDALASSRFSGNFVPSSHNQTEILRDGFSFGFDHMQPSLQIPFFGSNKVSSASSNAVVEATKRNSNKMEPKALIQNAPKKSRLEARSSCPPFKVRKEKLGDRIAALQQLVAPFGKTDTASVLMEAIGYIKFLQNQVETLSVPYMKASQNKTNRVMKAGPAENENEEPKRDLKNLGLCLVPLSCLSYITEGGGAAVWPPPHFGGAI